MMSAVTIVFMAALWISQDKIHIDPIADLRVVSYQATKVEKNVRPISVILNTRSPGEDTIKKSILPAYLMNLRDVCNYANDYDEYVNLIKPSMVLVKTNKGFIAGTATIGPKTCKLIKDISDPTIYVVSDTPFREGAADSQKYLVVESLKDGN
jgi:hypothetical protein